MNLEKFLFVCFSFVLCHDTFWTLPIVTRVFFTPRCLFLKTIRICLDNNRLLTDNLRLSIDISPTTRPFLLSHLSSNMRSSLAILVLAKIITVPIDSWLHIVGWNRRLDRTLTLANLSNYIYLWFVTTHMASYDLKYLSASFSLESCWICLMATSSLSW